MPQQGPRPIYTCEGCEHLDQRDDTDYDTAIPGVTIPTYRNICSKARGYINDRGEHPQVPTWCPVVDAKLLWSIPIVIDPSLPPGTARVVGADGSAVTIEGLAKP